MEVQALLKFRHSAAGGGGICTVHNCIYNKLTMSKSVESLLSSSGPISHTCEERDEQLDDLFAFATAKGALLDSIYAGQDSHGSRGLFAAEYIPAGG
jgi:hypothetical protein